MDWESIFTKPTVLIGAVVLVVLATTTLQIATNNQKNTDTRARASFAGSKTFVVAKADAASIQQSIDSAGNGDIIQIPGGTYSGATALAIGSADGVDLSTLRGTTTTCFLRIEGKTVTLKGPGVVLFGEGHDKPYQDPYQTRGGICVINGGVVLDGIKVKEFQKRCMVIYNSTVVAKNSVIEGCDEGGVSMLGDSKGLFVNNFFVATGAVLMWQNSFAKMVNNTIYASNIQYFFHPNSNDTAKVEAINNIIVNEENTIVQVGWWPTEVAKMNNSVFSNNLIWKNDKPCYPPLEYCADFPGKIVADPMFIEPVIDQRGMAAWANFGFKDGSPAIGKGDANIPGPKNLGQSGGPCSDPASAICSIYISANTPNITDPTPTNYPQITPTPTIFISPTPTPGVSSFNSKVFLVIFNPLLPNQNNLSLITYKNWNSPSVLASQYIDLVKSASHNILNYTVAGQQEINEIPLKKDGFRYTTDSYLACINSTGPCHNQPPSEDFADYQKIISDYNLCNKVNSENISEVWLFGGPWMGFYEANMAGPGGFWTNGPVMEAPACQKAFHFMGFSYERNAEEMLHNLGHRTEGTMKNDYDSLTNNPWNKYATNPNSNPGTEIFGCGVIHYPPNTSNEFEYNNTTLTKSNCEFWLNYPDMASNFSNINCQNWGCTHKGYLTWWLNHLPHTTGIDSFGKNNNWWVYITNSTPLYYPTPTLFPTVPTITIKPTNTPGPTTTPKPTSTPTVTPYPLTGPAKLPKTPPEPYPKPPICLSANVCPTRRNGDANCDKAINEADFTAWKFQFDTISVLPNDRNANFRCIEDNADTYFVDLTDFEVWRRFATGGLKK